MAECEERRPCPLRQALEQPALRQIWRDFGLRDAVTSAKGTVQ